MTGKRKHKNICINCYNQHGCLTEEPLCLLMERGDAEKTLPGQILMKRKGLLNDCQRCSQFRLCWKEDAYRKAMNKKS